MAELGEDLRIESNLQRDKPDTEINRGVGKVALLALELKNDSDNDDMPRLAKGGRDYEGFWIG